jgi:hypothetical protein
MATTAPAAPLRRGAARPRVSKRAEHLFFSAYMVALIAVIFAGFAPSFYLRGVAPAPAPLAPLRPDMVVHGILASLFMLAFPVQAILAARRRMKAHILLGNWAFALGAMLVPLGYVTGAGAYHAVRPVPIPREMLEGFLVLPLFGMAFLAIALAVAWRSRFDGQTHKRLMVALACLMADPAIFRLPIWTMGPEGLLFIQALMLATLVPLWLWDVCTIGRIHRGTMIGSGLFAGEVVLRTLAMPTAAWASLIHALPLYGMP